MPMKQTAVQNRNGRYGGIIMATKSKKPITPLVTYDADREEKRKALKTAMKQIEKDFGEGAIMKLGANPRMAVQAVHTGSLSLDMALGIGGVPRGRIKGDKGGDGFLGFGCHICIPP